MLQGAVGIARKQATYVLSKLNSSDVHQHQCQQKARYGQPQKRQKGDNVVTDRVFFDGGKNADGQGDAPSHQQCGKRQHQRQSHAFPNQVAHGLLPLKTQSEITTENDVGNPFPILDDHGLVQPEPASEIGRRVLVDYLIGGGQCGDVGGDIVARRQLDQHK
jgi:hypothetical protein